MMVRTNTPLQDKLVRVTHMDGTTVRGMVRGIGYRQIAVISGDDRKALRVDVSLALRDHPDDAFPLTRIEKIEVVAVGSADH